MLLSAGSAPLSSAEVRVTQPAEQGCARLTWWSARGLRERGDQARLPGAGKQRRRLEIEAARRRLVCEFRGHAVGGGGRHSGLHGRREQRVAPHLCTAQRGGERVARTTRRLTLLRVDIEQGLLGDLYTHKPGACGDAAHISAYTCTPCSWTRTESATCPL